MTSPSEALSLIPSRGFADETLRQVAHLDGGGTRFRLRLDNRFGQQPLHVGEARAARLASGHRVDPTTDTAVRFDGGTEVIVPAGAEIVSDPFVLVAAAGDDLAVSLYLPGATGPATYCTAAIATSWVVEGNHVRATSLPDGETVVERFFLSGIDVEAEPGTRVGVAFGDSLTAGAFTTNDANRRYPNLVNRRLRDGWLVNQGLAGNRLLTDEIGERGLGRLEHDVLAVPGAQLVVVNLGVNDLGFAGGLGLPGATTGQPPAVSDLVDGFTELAERCHAAGLRVLLTTLSPFGGALYPGFDTPEGREARNEVNAWIRSTAVVDGVADFAAALGEQEKQDVLRAEFDSGDGIHPNDSGSRAMADVIDIASLAVLG
jgi:lysophospholipase L1-like esterase